ncbi:glycine cleavage system H protein [Streptosporangium becharense]|uniref:Glycine cleavage system H protein n=1 Tax=Streptosporangium becharense TaxID=1816182 RepID=A0A7W9MFQ6_9ACTN|nr:glycine cleavage system protein GcvH [Streptosporangium becharense]MBB2910005.1 glycine cleavage system H protein [Streptosporangium becharense]MBB5819040.1 glycine cleavage system H protein [Streptosporangium becharense]
MSSIPEDLQYTKEHEWVSGAEDGITLTVGITAHAADALGEVVYVKLPEVGEAVTAGTPIGEVESTKSVSDVFAPVGGEVVEVNETLDANPALINSDPYGDGWLFRVRLEGSADDLLSAAEYTALTSGEA